MVALATGKKALWSGFLSLAFFGVSFLTLGSVLPSIRAALGFSLAQTSVLTAALPFGVLLGSVLFGPWSDKKGYRGPLVLSSLCVIVSLVGLSFFKDLRLLSLCVVGIGLGGGVLNGAGDAIVVDVSDDEHRSSNLCILGIFYGVGALCMPLLLGAFSQVPYAMILRYVSLALGVLLVFFYSVSYPTPKIQHHFPMDQVRQMLHSDALWLFSFILFFQSALEGICSSWIPTYLQESVFYNMETARSVSVLTFLVLGMVMCRLMLSFLFLHASPYKVLWGGFAMLLLGIVSLWSGWSADLSIFLIGFGLGATFPVIVGALGSRFRNLSGTAIGMALVIALGGNTLLNYLMRFIPIDSFPLYLLALSFGVIGLYAFTFKKLKLTK